MNRVSDIRRDASRYLRDAAEQLYLMIPWIRDYENQAKGITVLYAIDTNAVEPFINPPEAAKKEEPIFHTDDEQISRSLMRIMANHIFSTLVKQQECLLIFPEHASEVQRMYYAVMDKAGKSFEAVVSKREIVSELIELARSNKSREELNSAILTKMEKEDNFKELLEVITDIEGTKTGEFKRLSYLLGEHRFVTPEYYEKHNLTKSTGGLLKPVINAYKNIETEEYAELTKAWMKRLDKTMEIINAGREGEKKKKRTYLNMINDAGVLATIEILNRKIQNENTYLVFITRDMLVHKAAVEYCCESDQVRNTFCDLYIRHPRAFLAEKNIQRSDSVFPESEEANEEVDNNMLQLTEWLELFLAPLGDPEELRTKSNEELENISKDMIRNNGNVFAEFENTWREFTESFSLNDDILRNAVSELYSSIEKEKRTKDGEEDWNDIIKRVINSKVVRAWEKFFNIAVDGSHGLFFSSKAKVPHPARSVPALRFGERFRETREYVNSILKKGPDAPQLGLTNEERELLKSLKAKDESGYSYYLAVGLFFFMVGYWNITRILAKRAFHIANMEKYRDEIHGHEACYLSAISTRVTANSPGELIQVEHYLNGASRRYKEFVKDPNAYDIRFDAERTALCVTHHLFRIFCKFELSDGIDSLENCQKTIYNLLERIDREPDRIVRVKIERLLICNYFQILILRKFKEKENVTKEESEIGLLLDRFKRSIEKNDDMNEFIPTVSYRIQLVYLISSYLWGEIGEKEKKRTEIVALTKEDHLKEIRVLPYDEGRYRFYKKIIES